MTINLDTAVVYDIEVFPNVFTIEVKQFNSDDRCVWEISEFRDDRRGLIEFFNYCHHNQIAMIGFNNLAYDYPIIHMIMNNPNITYQQLYEKSKIILGDFKNRFQHMIWENERFAPQIDVYKINHFDNRAKSTGLKALQINMRLPNVLESSVEFDTNLTPHEIDTDLIPYGRYDVWSTDYFAQLNREAMEFRVNLVEQFGVDVMNWPDTKIGSRMMEDKLGKELCYDYSTGRRQIRQSPRTRIAINDIIFPYIQFSNPEFQRVLDYLRQQVLTSDEIKTAGGDGPAKIVTKGVFTGLTAKVGGLDFHFGTGGIHGSVSSQFIKAGGGWIIKDIDVKSLYPSIAIVNKLYPEHLGETFVNKYAELPAERAMWQEKKGKKCVEANAVKLAGNGVYGNSNNGFSAFYDPRFTMTITINGQLMLCMLAERLATVPTLKLIQINTDGITYYIHEDNEPQAVAICQEWEKQTALILEDADYSRMWIRDVNSYVAEDVDGDLKLKGAYWSPDPLNYHASISAAQPPAWHKDLGKCVVIRAALAAMVHGIDPEQFIRMTTNPYDFMCRIKVNRSDNLYHGDQVIQKNSRYYVSTDGQGLVKMSPPTGVEGSYKRAAKITQNEYERVMAETGGRWDERVCTKNKSTHVIRRTQIQAGHKVSICNDVNDFDFSNVNYDWYVNEAKKLIIV